MLSLRHLFPIIAIFAATASASKPCTSLALPDPPPGTSLINITSIERHDVTVTGTRFNGTGTVSNISFCDVEIYLTHGSYHDAVRIAVWLPLPIQKWSGRFMGTGGSGFRAGIFDPALAEGVADGFAAASTDAGVGNAGDDPSSWAQNHQLVKNFVYLGIHEMTIVSKQVTEQFYGKKPTYSYFHGCSQGGRQGYREALEYPDDYHGISAHSPGINWDRLLPGFLWPYLQKLQTPGLTACKIAGITAASIAACDRDDGGVDGLISYPPSCKFDATSLVGQDIAGCDADKTITKAEAEAWNSIRDGPKDRSGKSIWYGMQPGSDISFVTLAPFAPGESWLKDFILRSPNYNTSTLTYDDYLADFAKSVKTLGQLWGSPSADLSAFKKRGGKLLSFHGWSDQSVPGESTIEYWNRVSQTVGGVDDFYRLFMAPGVGHCAAFGYGPGPWSLMDTLVDWVEQGKAPDTLFAAGFGKTRNLCRYPRRLMYKGSGSIEEASSWTCV